MINQLRKKTLEGKVAWEATLDEGVYQASFPSYSVRLFPKSAKYVLQINNEEGGEIYNEEEGEINNEERIPTTRNYNLRRRKPLNYNVGPPQKKRKYNKKRSVSIN